MRNSFFYCLIIGLLLTGSLALAMGEKPKAAPDNSLKDALGSGLPVIVKLGADWCPPCQQMKPILKELAQELRGKVIVLDLDINDHRDLAAKLKIRYIPTTIFYDKNGRDKLVKTGFMDKQEILRIVKELRLEQVR